jgi:hypothetical protein
MTQEENTEEIKPDPLTQLKNQREDFIRQRDTVYAQHQQLLGAIYGLDQSIKILADGIEALPN